MIKTLIMMLAISSLAITVGTTNAYGDETMTGTLTIDSSCGITIDESSLNFGNLEIGNESNEIHLTINNIGTENIDLKGHATDWLDTDGKTIMIGSLTKTSDTSVTYAEKASLEDNIGDALTVINVPAGIDGNVLYFQVSPTLNVGEETFSGALTQTISLAVECV